MSACDAAVPVARAYGARTSPVEEFDFEEETGVGDQSKYTWTNAAYAMAVNVKPLVSSIWLVHFDPGRRVGGAVEGLAVHKKTFPSDERRVDMTVPPKSPSATGARWSGKLGVDGAVDSP